MRKIKDTVQVNIAHFSGHDEGDDGLSYYVAASDDLMFTTQGSTFEELLENIRECLILCLRETDSVAEYWVSPQAGVTIA